MTAAPRTRWRVAYFVSHPIQYQAPLLRFLSSQDDIDLVTFFISDISLGTFRDPGFETDVAWDVPLLEDYEHRFLDSWTDRSRLSFLLPLSRGMRNALEDQDFDAIWVHGWGHLTILRALRIARSLDIPILLRGESTLMDRGGSGARAALRNALTRRILDRPTRFMAIGSANRAFYEHFGIPADRISMMPYAVDNEFFRVRAEEARHNRADLQAALGLEEGRPVILYASKLISRKGPYDLLEAYAHLSPDGIGEPDPYLVMVGDGPEREQLERLATKMGWDSIRFPGFQNQSALPRFYNLCDVFVLPSRFEPWGLVINEVMNAARPVIASDSVGAAPDLVTDGETGLRFPSGDVDALARCLSRLCADPALRSRMGRQALTRISDWGYQQDADGLRDALSAVAPR